MDEQAVFDNAAIAAGIIRFGNVSYQASNITSLNVLYQRKINNFAQASLVLALVVAIAAGFLYQQNRDFSIWVVGMALVLFAVGVIWQHFWPLQSYTLQIKMTSGEVQSFKSSDRKQVFELKSAIERTFVRHS